MQGNSHIVATPKGLFVLRILQIVFAVIVVGMTAYLISNTYGLVFGAEGFAIFLGILTLLVLAYDLVSEKAVKNAYNMWAVLALDIIMVVFWLSCMGALAALRAAFDVTVNVNFRKRYTYALAGNVYLAILSATAGVAAIELIFFIATLVMFSMRLHRHRQTHAPSNTGGHPSSKIELQQSGAPHPYAPNNNAGASYAGNPNYQPPVNSAMMQPQHTGVPAPAPYHHQNNNAVSPSSQGYPTPTVSPAPQPPPQFAQQPVVSQYSNTQAPVGYHEAGGQYR